MTVAAHMPLSPNASGNSSTLPVSKTNVRRNETSALTPPLFNAVKNEEVKMLKPPSKKQKAWILSAPTVIRYRFSSYPTKTRQSEGALSDANAHMQIPDTPISKKLLCRRFFSSFLLPAP